MKYLLLPIALMLAFISLSQKVKIKDDIAYIDGVEYVKYIKKNMANEASIMSLNTEDEDIFISYQDYTDPNKISKSNPEGKVRWIEVNFLTLDLKCEVSSRTHKGLVKLLYENNIYVDGALNAENVELFVKKYGTKFSDNRPGGNVNIIINN